MAQSEEQPKPSTAFEEAAKKLSSGKSGAELFAATRAQEGERIEAEEQKAAQRALGEVVEVCIPFLTALFILQLKRTKQCILRLFDTGFQASSATDSTRFYLHHVVAI